MLTNTSSLPGFGKIHFTNDSNLLGPSAGFAAMNENNLHYSSLVDVDRLIIGWQILSLSVPIELRSSSATTGLSSTYFNLLLLSVCHEIQNALEKTLQETYQRLHSSEG